MQAAERGEVTEIRIGPGMRLELPEPILDGARAVLGPLFEGLFPLESLGLPAARSGDALMARVEMAADGWWLEHGRSRERTASEGALLLRLQEISLEAVARCRGWLLFRGSLVTRGSQSVLIVGDQGDAHIPLALALAALEFRPVSIGLTAFGGRPPRGYPAPLPLPLAFPLAPEELTALQALPQVPNPHVVRIAPALFRACRVTAAPEPTHVLFPEPLQSPRSLMRPISATTARARLCGALTVAPDDPPPFAAVAAVVHHARGIHLPLGDLSPTLEQLARLLPRWSVD